MKIKLFISTIATIFIIGIILIAFFLNINLDSNVDTVTINQIVKNIENSWNHLDKEDLSASNLDFAIIDINEKVLFSTIDGIPDNVNDAIKKREIIVDVMVKDALVGRVIFHNNHTQLLSNTVRKILLVVVITFSAIALLCIFYILYLNSAVFKPFKKLKGFAQNIANGNLDVPLEMDRKNLFGAFSESFDIMREELAIAKRNEYLANRSKKELVASLSHDIKTPVSSIKAVSEFMLVLATDEKEKERLNAIYFKAEQINLLVNDMFHATLEELEELKVTVKEEYSTIIYDIIKNANYYDKIEHDPIPECIISTDTTRLQQVFDNIISNSYKYANTSVYIAFNITSTQLVVDIIDYGKGVPEDELPLLFNKFRRGSNAEGQAGSGLGLYISKYFMEKMGGEITCHNQVDGFKVTLKIKLSS